MSSSPSLLQWDSSVVELPRVGPTMQARLKDVGIRTIGDLLMHLPSRYEDFSQTLTTLQVREAEQGSLITIQASIKRISAFRARSGRQMITATLQDQEGTLQALWFGQQYLLSTLREGTEWRFSGKVSSKAGKVQLVQPTFERADVVATHTGRVLPVYPSSAELSSRILRGLIAQALSLVEVIPDDLSEEKRAKYGLLPLDQVLHLIHHPTGPIDVGLERQVGARELIKLLTQAKARRTHRQSQKAYKKLQLTTVQRKQFEKSLPYTPSPSQSQAMFDLAIDLMQAYPARRLIQGEVGAGKTAIAAFACFMATQNGGDSAYLCPTQMLATEHFATLSKIFAQLKIPVQLITSGTQVPAKHDPTVFVGTHALLKKKLKPAVVVIDEEHRFGVEQREFFSARTHHISLTATPIPRTVASTMFADLEVSYLDRPEDRAPRITTKILHPNDRTKALDWLNGRVSRTQQLIAIAPFIDRSGAENLSSIVSVHELYEELRSSFPKKAIGLLHGRLSVQERTDILEKMNNQELEILVSTPVIEVGVNLPHADFMIIENPERFGLAQLHQLRGRIGRRGQQAVCILHPRLNQPEIAERLAFFATHMNGNQLAEYDLKRRGAGELFGTAQSGHSVAMQLVYSGQLEDVLKGEQVEF